MDAAAQVNLVKTRSVGVDYVDRRRVLFEGALTRPTRERDLSTVRRPGRLFETQAKPTIADWNLWTQCVAQLNSLAGVQVNHGQKHAARKLIRASLDEHDLGCIR